MGIICMMPRNSENCHNLCFTWGLWVCDEKYKTLVEYPD